MTELEIRNNIKDIVLGNLRFADPQDEICKEATTRYNKEKVDSRGLYYSISKRSA